MRVIIHSVDVTLESLSISSVNAPDLRFESSSLEFRSENLLCWNF
jgi:hypothetical protein